MKIIAFSGNAPFLHENLYNDLNLCQSLGKTMKWSLYIATKQQNRYFFTK